MNAVENQGYLGNFAENETVHIMFSAADTDGETMDFGGSPQIVIFKGSNEDWVQTGMTYAKISGMDGLYRVTVVTTDSFYIVDTDYSMVVIGTVDGKGVDAAFCSFSIAKRV